MERGSILRKFIPCGVTWTGCAGFLLAALSAPAQSSISIAVNPNPAGFAQSVTLTSKVTSSGVAASGWVLFYDSFAGLSTAIAVAELDASGGGAATLATLGVGQHALTACWEISAPAAPPESCPDATVSPPLVLTILESTATTLQSSQNPAQLGAGITLTATVADKDGGGVQPAGNVDFANGDHALCTAVALVGGVANCAVTADQLIQGSNALTANYDGNASLSILGSSAALTETVLSATAVTLSAAPNPATAGQPVTVLATVFPYGAILPTGAVEILDGGVQIGTAQLAGSSNLASYLTATLAQGSHPLTAIYPGDAVHAASPGSPVLIEVVNAAPGQQTPDFSLTLTPASLSAVPGSSATASVALNSLHGFAGAVTLGCSSLPATVSCVFASNPVALTAGGSQTVQLNVQVGGASTAALLLLPAALILMGRKRRGERQGMRDKGQGVREEKSVDRSDLFTAAAKEERWESGTKRPLFIRLQTFAHSRIPQPPGVWILSALLLLPIAFLSNCGGGGVISGSQLRGTHTLVVTASGGGQNHSQTLTLTITQ